MDAAVSANDGEHNPETDELGNGRGKTGAGHAHLETEDEQRVEGDVEHHTGEDANHREGRIALQAHLVIHHKHTRHKRGAQQDISEVGPRYRQNGLRGTEETQQRIHKQETANCHKGGQDDGGEKARGGHRLGLLELAGAQGIGNENARPLAEKERYGLQQGHIDEDDAEGGCGLRVDLAHEEGVHHIVEASGEHTDHRGDGHFAHQTPDGLGGHLLIFSIALIHHILQLQHPFFSGTAKVH